MADLTPEQVRSLAAAIGLSITDDDLDDVTFRLNATLEKLNELQALDPAGDRG
jgi:Asp-tRNA(Asn)/Glu-tRNA(Gln) amidotransferase C subunit